MIKIESLLNPKNDYVFRRIFGQTGNEEITKNFLMSIIPDKIEEIRLDCNPITKEELSDDKVGILDIKAKLNNNVNCNIEMQIVDKNNIEKRILFYWSKMYIGGIKKGEDYSVLERTIVILITDYNLKQLKEIPEYMTKWNLRSDKYPKKILTDALEIYIIEANKAEEFSFKNNKTLDSWLKFINNPKEESQMENEEIKKAKKVLEEISQDKKEREMSELREKYIMDQKAVYKQGYEYGKEAGIKQGIRQGIEQGIKQGIQQGVQNKAIEIAKKMKNENTDLKTITKFTGLTEEEILKI